MPEPPARPRYGLRVALFLSAAVLIFLVLNTLFAALNTLQRLKIVEAERDQWQRPSEVLRALDLQPGNVAADLGCGAGYFALKLSSSVGPRGSVLAVDIRTLSLLFVWIRAFQGGAHNVHVIAGDQDNPRLPAGAVDAVLIANAYHEFHDPERMLEFTFRALRPGGRLVIVDRQAEPGGEGHNAPMSATVEVIRRKGFDIAGQNGDFIDRPGDAWWLVIARKP